jgi:hypothetical protein
MTDVTVEVTEIQVVEVEASDGITVVEVTIPGAQGPTGGSGGGGGSGDVTKDGTPVDNQVGVWTGDGTIEGDTALTFDTSTDTLTVAASGKINFGAVNVLTDTAGTTTLANIDALDATTESTVESAIDTLANLTSVQGRTVTLADAGADVVFGWDDSANAYENLTAAEVQAIISPLPVANGGTGQTTEAEAVGELIQALTADSAPSGPNDYLGTYDASADTGKKITIDQVRELRLATSDMTFYVRTDGSDSNTGLVDSAGGAFLTPYRAAQEVLKYDWGLLYKPTIQFADGTYTITTGTKVDFNWPVGVERDSNYSILGNIATPANVVISSSKDGFCCKGGNAFNNFVVRGFKFITNVGNGLTIQDGSLLADNLAFDCADCNLEVKPNSYCELGILAGGTTTLSTANSSLATRGCFFVRGELVVGGTIALSGTPAWGALGFIFMSHSNSLTTFGPTVTGTATGRRYRFEPGSSYTGTGSFTDPDSLPGSTAGIFDPLALNQGYARAIGFDTNTTVNFYDWNVNEILKFPTTVASAVNEITISNAATGNPPSITASGETDVGLRLSSKGTGTVRLAVGGTDEVLISSTSTSPNANDGNALGTTSLGWSDLHLATGALINVANSNWVATHSSGIMTVSTGDLRVTTAGTNTASVVTVGGTQTLTAKTLTSPTIITSPTASGATWTDLGSVTTVDINGGTVDGTTIGATSRAAASFSTATVGTTSSLVSVDGASTYFQIANADNAQWHGTVGLYHNSASGPEVAFVKSRHGTVGSHTVVAADDSLGVFRWYGSDGTDFEQAGYINLLVDGTPAGDTTDMPGRMEFGTTPDGSDTPATRLTIKNDGGVIVGPNGTSPGAGMLAVTDEAYSASWDGSLSVPTKNALYDKIETISAGGATTNQKRSALGISIDGGGSAITTGIKGDIYVPYDCTVESWTILADQTGSIEIDVWSDTYANYPPTSADIGLFGESPPRISSAIKATSTDFGDSPSGADTSISAGTTLRFNVNSISSITRATLTLGVIKT